MVWEQGSIVIVNLTRLTENGMSLCHRYWPEEGSDLYHIYEVRPPFLPSFKEFQTTFQIFFCSLGFCSFCIS